jgi:hypothetical protein
MEEKRDGSGVFEVIRGVMDATDIGKKWGKDVRLSLQPQVHKIVKD